uniref:Uncharacterized protein n=1 Tax=viral metagenome TaxID=1070528 RepID=A0A6C0LI55_9ZZZZ
MNNVLEYGWIICFIVAYLIQVLVSMGLNNNNNIDRGSIFFELIAWVLSVIGFIMFVVWLNRFNDTKVLNTMWIVSLITLIVSCGIVIFMVGNVSGKTLVVPTYLIGYSFTILIGTLITFLFKNK